MVKKITKGQANKAATVVRNYAAQEAKSHLKNGAKVTKAAVSKAAKKGFSKLKSLF